MSSDPHVEACLRALRALSDALEADLVALSPAEWDRPTNCPPWRVRDIVAHVVVSGEGFAASIRQGLAGSVETGVSTAARERRQAEIETAEPVTVARALRSVTDDFIGLYTDLQDQELATICFHRRGNRSIRWYAAHRLAEVAFHDWDIQFSLGRDPRLDEPVAALLLPTLLESNAPRIYAAGLIQQRGNGERFLLTVADDPAAHWLIQIDPDQLEAHRGDAPADLAIAGSAATLALLVYGRSELTALAQSGAVRLDGDLALAGRFPQIFPRP